MELNVQLINWFLSQISSALMIVGAHDIFYAVNDENMRIC